MKDTQYRDESTGRPSFTSKLKSLQKCIRRSIQNKLELQSLMRYLVIVVVPMTLVLFILTGFLISDYTQRETERLYTMANDSLSRMDQLINQLYSTTVQMAGNRILSKSYISANAAAYSDIRSLITYITSANGLDDTVFYSGTTPSVFYTKMGTYNEQYFKHYELSDGVVATALDVCRNMDGLTIIPRVNLPENKIEFSPTVDFFFKIPQQADAYVIYSMTEMMIRNHLIVSMMNPELLVLLDNRGKQLLPLTQEHGLQDDVYDKLRMTSAGNKSYSIDDDYMLICSTMSSYGMSLGILVDRSQMYSAVKRMSWLLYGTSLLLMLMVAGMLTILSYWSARPIKELLTLAESLYDDPSYESSNAGIVARLRNILVSLQEIHLPIEPTEENTLLLTHHTEAPSDDIDPTPPCCAVPTHDA